MVRKTELSERCEDSMRTFSDPDELRRRGLRKQRRKCQTISSTDNFMESWRIRKMSRD